MLTGLSTSSSFHQHTGLHRPPLIRIGSLEHFQSWTKMQRTQRTHHATEGNDMCSRFSGLSSDVGVYGCSTMNQRNLLPLLSSSFTTSKPVTFTKHALTIKAISKVLRTRQHGHFTTLLFSQLLPPVTSHLSSLCHWELEVARTSEKERS